MRESEESEYVDLYEVLRRLGRALPQILGFGLLGGVVALFLVLAVTRTRPEQVSMRVAFSFAGFERGQYPDGSGFQPDDLRSADLVMDALRSTGVDSPEKYYSRVRSAITIEGLLPALSKSEADTVTRVLLQNPAQKRSIFVPDEYEVQLAVPEGVPLDAKQARRLLVELISLYTERFHRTYVKQPERYAAALGASGLQSAEYFEFAELLRTRVGSLRSYLGTLATSDASFRDPVTGYSFNDLIAELDVFAQLQVEDLVTAVGRLGLARDRDRAVSKIEYRRRELTLQERALTDRLQATERLLAALDSREQSYVLGARSQQDPTKPNVIDQNVLDALISNDARNKLVEKASDLGASIADARVQQTRLADQLARIQAGPAAGSAEWEAGVKEIASMLEALEADYQRIVSGIRSTVDARGRQRFADAVRMTRSPKRSKQDLILVAGPVMGGLLGAMLGAGLGLIGIVIGRRHRVVPSASPVPVAEG